MAEITVKNIMSFFEGNFKHLYYKVFGKPDFIKEQIAYRIEKCKKDCIKTGKCVYCGCPTDKKMLVVASCNKGERFPDLMNKDKWQEYKDKKYGKQIRIDI